MNNNLKPFIWHSIDNFDGRKGEDILIFQSNQYGKGTRLVEWNGDYFLDTEEFKTIINVTHFMILTDPKP